MSGGTSLIHPHEHCNLPGYLGYTPQLKFHCGNTYGRITDKLTKELSAGRPHKFADDPKLHLPDLATSRNDIFDQKYVKQMVPGYTGFVPQHAFKYGQTYALGTEEAIKQCKYNYTTHAREQCDLQGTINARPPLRTIQTAPADMTHPGVNMRYCLAFGKHFNEKREFTEAPIPGYQGYVPCKEEHVLGKKYNVWTRHAYNDANESMEADTLKKGANGAGGTHVLHSTPSTSRLNMGNIYSKRLGMIPNYTGYVPQRRFDFGTTYGDSTRNMPVCADTFGYSWGKYRDKGKTVTPTVIPIRN